MRSEFVASLCLQDQPGAYVPREDASAPLRVGASFRKPGKSEARHSVQPVRPALAFAFAFVLCSSVALRVLVSIF